MSLINPFGGDKAGNSRERLNKLEMEIARHQGILMAYGSLFELLRRFFMEVTAASQTPSSASNPDTEHTDKHQAANDQPKQ
jgi:hypothetical protein